MRFIRIFENYYYKSINFVCETGTTSYSGSSSSILKEVTVPVWPLKDCQNVYGKEKITEKQICAGLKQGGKGKATVKFIL